ncbi:MAG: hypothetical protein GX366_01640 [Epulopiscium sp.]|nr:hypothetical protein [Candidatus Epulonipiscium sp.]
MKELVMEKFNIEESVYDFCTNIEDELSKQFDEIKKITEYNGLKILHAMQENGLSDMHFAATTGYGYNDLGRELIEEIYANVFGAEAGLVRPQLMSGTHALTVAFFGNLRPGDELLSVTGKPYDTLDGVIGITEQNGSLAEYGVSYAQADLKEDFSFDFDAIKKAINPKTKMVTIQRSKGYKYRPTLSVREIGQVIKFVKDIRSDIICMVDNCYGEFVEIMEPSEVGADLVVGSLIKNPGGGLAPTGGYIVGNEEYVENAAIRLSAPGLGKDVGATLGLNQQILQGLFFAPEVVENSLRSAIIFSRMFEKLGFNVMPKYDEPRCDIIQAIQMNTSEQVISFCQGIQKAAPVDSYVTPIPSDMPGYDAQVIMAAGTFIQGASIELSADAPIKAPYTVYFQGGLTGFHAKIAPMITLQNMINEGYCTII